MPTAHTGAKGGAQAGVLSRAKAWLAAALLLGGLGLALPAQNAANGNGLVGVAQAKTSGLSSYNSGTSTVENGLFAISASEYADRVNAAFEEIGRPDYKVSLTKSVDGTTLDMDIRYKSKLVGVARFRSAGVDDSYLSYSERNSNKAFDNILTTWFYDDDIAAYSYYSITAMTMAADSSLDKHDAQGVSIYLAYNVDTIRDGYFGSTDRLNGIRYTLVIDSDGNCFFSIDCS